MLYNSLINVFSIESMFIICFEFGLGGWRLELKNALITNNKFPVESIWTQNKVKLFFTILCKISSHVTLFLLIENFVQLTLCGSWYHWRKSQRDICTNNREMRFSGDMRSEVRGCTCRGRCFILKTVLHPEAVKRSLGIVIPTWRWTSQTSPSLS